MGSVSPFSMTGAEGLPGWRSTKKLPSRKMRGRIVSVASLWMGWAILVISIVMTAAWRPPGAGSTFLTPPTWTPAIRTNDAVFRRFAVGTAALIVNVGTNGTVFVSPKYMTGIMM